jgi:hypothetical protein
VDQPGHAGLRERVLQLGRAVLRVHRHQDHPGQGRAELEHDPLRAVGFPDGDPLAGLEPGQQGPGHILGDGEQLGVIPPAPGRRRGLAVHQGDPVGHLPGYPAEQVSHGDLVQRDAGPSGPVGRGQH